MKHKTLITVLHHNNHMKKNRITKRSSFFLAHIPTHRDNVAQHDSDTCACVCAHASCICVLAGFMQTARDSYELEVQAL